MIRELVKTKDVPQLVLIRCDTPEAKKMSAVRHGATVNGPLVVLMV